jgi:uncharacterized protein (DUF697 family)
MTNEYSKALELSYLAWLAYTTELVEIHEKLQASELQSLQAYQIVELLKEGSERYGFVALSSDEEIVIAVKGTASVKDWMYNLLAVRTADEVHFGFQLYTEPIWKQLQTILPQLLQDKRKIITTGHSLGGASATLIAHKLSDSELKASYSDLETYTFGAPPLGNESVKLATPLYRFRTPGDLVPHLPLLGGCIVEMSNSNLSWIPQVHQALAELSQTLNEYCHPEPEYLLHSTGEVYKLDTSQLNIQTQQSEFLRVLLEKPDHGSAFAEITSSLGKILQFQGNIQSFVTDSIMGYLGKIVEIVLIEHDILQYIQALDIEETLPQSIFTEPEPDIEPEKQAVTLTIGNKTMTDTSNPIDNPYPTETTSEITYPAENKQSNWWDGAFSAVTGAVGNAVGDAAGAVGGAMVVAGDAVGGAAGAVSGAAVVAAGMAGSAIGGAAGAVGGAMGAVGGVMVEGISTATSNAGYLIEAVGNSDLLKDAARIFKADWLMEILDQIDVSKSEDEVKRLKQQYPNESANQIAQRIIGQKAMFAGASGFATSIVPGSAAALFSVDLIATTSLQAEMVYQIACAYGMDLKDPARKGEVVAVFGLAFGGKMALKAGLGLLRNVPLAGAVIAASSDAVMLYTLGQASCAFHEAKLNPVNFEQQLESIQNDSEERLKSALPQEEIIDQILVHVILAGNKDRNKESVLADLRAANLRPESIDSISEYMDSPLPLEILLTNIKPEFALTLLVQCQKFAKLDGVVTPEELQVIEMIQQKLTKV